MAPIANIVPIPVRMLLTTLILATCEQEKNQE